MRAWSTLPLVLLALAVPLSLLGQGTPVQGACSTSPNASKPCPVVSPAQQFPYPGDPAPSSPAPDATSAGKQFPYPGDAKADDRAHSSSSSSSNSSSSAGASSSSASSNDPDDPLDVPPSTPSSATGNTVRRKLPKPTHLQSDDEREAEDVRVASFYADSGNNLGAYNRLKDALKLAHDDADAFYLLGTVATRLNKQPEATDAFGKFLELEPDTRRAKTLRHALAENQAKK